MTQHGPVDSYILVGGKDVSPFTFTLSDEQEQELEQSNAIKTNFEASKPIGLARVMIEAAGGFYEDSVGGILDALQAKGQTLQQVAWGNAGWVPGAMCRIINGTYATIFKRIINRSEITKAHAIHKLTGVPMEAVVVNGFTAIVTDPGNSQTTPADQLTNTTAPGGAITSSSVANPSTITTPQPHGLITGDDVFIANHAGSTPSINGQRTVTVTGANTFTIPLNVTVGGTGGTFVKVTSTNGTADLHVTELTLDGHTNFTPTLVHSADNSTYVTLQAFDPVTLVGTTQRKTITGQIRRYAAFSWDFAGAGGANRRAVAFIALAR